MSDVVGLPSNDIEIVAESIVIKPKVPTADPEEVKSRTKKKSENEGGDSFIVYGGTDNIDLTGMTDAEVMDGQYVMILPLNDGVKLIYSEGNEIMLVKNKACPILFYQISWVLVGA